MSEVRLIGEQRVAPSTGGVASLNTLRVHILIITGRFIRYAGPGKQGWPNNEVPPPQWLYYHEGTQPCWAVSLFIERPRNDAKAHFGAALLLFCHCQGPTVWSEPPVHRRTSHWPTSSRCGTAAWRRRRCGRCAPSASRHCRASDPPTCSTLCASRQTLWPSTRTGMCASWSSWVVSPHRRRTRSLSYERKACKHFNVKERRFRILQVWPHFQASQCISVGPTRTRTQWDSTAAKKLVCLTEGLDQDQEQMDAVFCWPASQEKAIYTVSSDVEKTCFNINWKWTKALQQNIFPGGLLVFSSLLKLLLNDRNNGWNKVLLLLAYCEDHFFNFGMALPMPWTRPSKCHAIVSM